jgi:predicted dehydrogenase
VTGNVRIRPELEGGALMDVGCYCVSALRLLCGEPVAATAQAVDRQGVDGRFVGTLRFDGDVLGLLDCGFDVPNLGKLEVVGADGTLIAEDPWHGASPRLTLRRPDGDVEEIPVAAEQPYRLELEDFSRAVRGGDAPRLGREDAVGQARAIEMLYASVS